MAPLSQEPGRGNRRQYGKGQDGAGWQCFKYGGWHAQGADLGTAEGGRKEEEGPGKREGSHVSTDVAIRKIDLSNAGNCTAHILNTPCNIFCPRFAEKTVQHMLESFYSDQQSVQIPRGADVVCPWKQLNLAIQIESLQSNASTLRAVALINSGCTISVIDNEYMLVNGIELFPLTKPIHVLNADGSENRKGLITHYAKIWIMIGEHIEVHPLLSAQLGADEPIFLGHKWLTHHNPNIDWCCAMSRRNLTWGLRGPARV
jgi:hypothetical protein